MKISRISCAGFRGVKGALEIDVPSGFLVLAGSNGAGKSSICDAVEFALTGELRSGGGETERQEKISDYVWWRGKGEPNEEYVAVWMVDEDGLEHEIRRTRKGLACPESELNVRALTCDVRRMPSDPVPGILESAIIRDEEVTRLSIDLQETERYRLVRSAVGETDLPRFAKTLQDACSLLSSKVQQAEERYVASRSHIAFFHERIAELQAEVASTEIMREAESRLQELLDLPNTTALALVEAGRKKILESRERADKLALVAKGLVEIEEQKKRIQSSEFWDEQEMLRAALDQVRSLVRSREEEREKLDAEFAAVSSNESEVRLMATLLDVGERIGLRNGECPLCGSEITEATFGDHVRSVRKQVARIDAELIELTRRQADLEQELQASRSRLLRAERAVSDHGQLLAMIQQQEADLLRELEDLALGSVGGSSSVRSAAESAWMDAAELDRYVSTLEASRAAEAVGDLERRLSAVREEGDLIQREVTAARMAHGRAKAALDSVRRIEGELIEERLARLGPLLEELYLRLRPHSDWPRLQYHIRGDVRRFLSLKVGDDLNPRFLFSSGQKRAIGIAFLLAVYLGNDWSRLRSLILDDPVQHIDDFRALHLVELLSAIRKSGRQVICTTADIQLAELLGRRLQGIHNEDGLLVELEYAAGDGVRQASYRRYSPIEERITHSA